MKTIFERKRVILIILLFSFIYNIYDIYYAVPHDIPYDVRIVDEISPLDEIYNSLQLRGEDVIWSTDFNTNKNRAVYKNGEPLVGIIEVEKDGIRSKFYFDNNGVVYTGWNRIGVDRYYFDNEGRMVVGLARIDGRLFYFDDNGVFLQEFTMPSMYQWRQIEFANIKDWYVFDIDNNLVTGFVKYKNNIYYLNESENYKGKLMINYTIEKNGRDYVTDFDGKVNIDISELKEPYIDMDNN